MNRQATPSPDPERWAVLRSAGLPLPLDAVAEAVAQVSNGRRHLYVERRGDRFAWSVAHRGGPYPLMREVAAYVGLPDGSLAVSAQGLGDWSVLIGPNGDDDRPPPDVWAVITLPASVGAAEANRAILDALDASAVPGGTVAS